MARPTAFKEDYIEQGHQLALLGMTNEQMAAVFGVSLGTLKNWLKRHKKFRDEVMRGKAVADGKVAASLFERACGYSHPDTHISNYKGEITITEITKHYPPDTGAAIIWLKNRQPDLWRDRIEVKDPDNPLLALAKALQGGPLLPGKNAGRVIQHRASALEPPGENDEQ